MIDQTLCKHNIVNDGVCMMCNKTLTKTDLKMKASFETYQMKRQEPGYVSPLRSDANDRDEIDYTPYAKRATAPQVGNAG